MSLQGEIQKNKELVIEYEQSVQKSKLSIISEQLLLQSVRKKLEDLKYVIRKLYREEEDLTEKLKNNVKPKRTIRDALASKRVELKGKELLESELSRKYERITEQIRLLNTDVRHQTNEIIEIELKIQEDTFKVRHLKKKLSKEVTSSEEMKETLTEMKQSQDKSCLFSPHSRGRNEGSRLTFTSPVTDYSINTSNTSLMKMIDYDGLVERSESLIIGHYGTHETSPRFIHPCGITIDINDGIYVADMKNARVQILSLNGIPVRKPIDLSKNFQPSSITVNSIHHVFVTDSHVVRAYSSNGELLRYILPIYGKTDVRPQITGLATTNDDAILLVDRANKQIQKFRQDGTFQRFVGGNHVFQSPFGVAVAKNGDIVVSDACQITILDGGTEKVKTAYGTRGIGKGKFLNPRGLAVDIDNNIIVADCESHQIHVLNVEDGKDSFFGSLGTDAGFFDTPCDVAVSSDGKKIVVVEAKNHRLQIFKRPCQDSDYDRYISKV